MEGEDGWTNGTWHHYETTTVPLGLRGVWKELWEMYYTNTVISCDPKSNANEHNNIKLPSEIAGDIPDIHVSLPHSKKLSLSYIDTHMMASIAIWHL